MYNKNIANRDNNNKCTLY